MSRARLIKVKELETFYLKNAKESMKTSVQLAINLYYTKVIVQYNKARNLLHDLTSSSKTTRNLALKELEKISGESQDKTVKSIKQMEKNITRLDEERKQLEKKLIKRSDIEYLTYREVKETDFHYLASNRRKEFNKRFYEQFGSVKSGIVKAPTPFPQSLF